MHINPKLKENLGKAVLCHFSSRPYHEVDMRAVSKTAGISLGTIYKYYRSKEKLLLSFVDESLIELVDRLADHLQGIEDVKEKLRKVFWVALDFYERNSELGKIVFITIPEITWMADSSYKQKGVTDIFFNVIKQGQREGYLNQNLSAVWILDIWWGLSSRMFKMWVYRNEKQSLSKQSNILFDIVWNGISNPER